MDAKLKESLAVLESKITVIDTAGHYCTLCDAANGEPHTESCAFGQIRAAALATPAPVAPASGAITVNAATGPNGPFDLPAAPAPVGEPWLYAIEGPNGEWKDGETCVFGDRASAQDEVDLLND